MIENRESDPLDPTPNYDCHVSKAANIPASASPKSTFESTQIYLYEYGDLDLEQHPSQIYPYALLHFTHKGHSKYRPAIGPQISKSSPKLSHPKADEKPPATNPLPQTSDPTPPQNGPVAVPAPIPAHRSASFPPPCPQMGSPQPIPPLTALSPRTAVPPPSPGIVLQELRDLTQVETRVGQASGEGSVVIWEGDMMNKEKTVCDVELVSYGSLVKPARLGRSLVLQQGITIAHLEQHLLPTPFSVDRQSELSLGPECHVSYCELRPVDTTTAKASFNQVMASLDKGNVCIFIKLEDNVKLFLLSHCKFTQKLGLSKKKQYPMLLHCIFVSPISRLQALQDMALRLSAKKNLSKNSQGSAEVRVGPFGDVDMRFACQPTATSIPPDQPPHPSSSPLPPSPVTAASDEFLARLSTDFDRPAPVTSRVFRESIAGAFQEQSVAQDRRNIDIARGIYRPAPIGVAHNGCFSPGQQILKRASSYPESGVGNPNGMPVMVGQGMVVGNGGGGGLALKLQQQQQQYQQEQKLYHRQALQGQPPAQQQMQPQFQQPLHPQSAQPLPQSPSLAHPNAMTSPQRTSLPPSSTQTSPPAALRTARSHSADTEDPSSQKDPTSRRSRFILGVVSSPLRVGEMNDQLADEIILGRSRVTKREVPDGKADEGSADGVDQHECTPVVKMAESPERMKPETSQWTQPSPSSPANKRLKLWKPATTGSTTSTTSDLHVRIRNENLSPSHRPPTPQPLSVDFNITNEMMDLISSTPRSMESANTPRLPLERATAFLMDVADRLTTPEQALHGLDMFNRALFEDVRVCAGSSMTDVTVECRNDGVREYDGLSDEQRLEQSIYEVIHRYDDDDDMGEENEEEAELTELWIVSLHYLLPVIDWLQQSDRQVTDITPTEDDAQMMENNIQPALGKSHGQMRGDARGDRYHPYRRSAQSDIQQRLREYRNPKDLNDLLQCLTVDSYRERRERIQGFGPLLQLFSRPQLFEPPRFQGYNFQRSSVMEPYRPAAQRNRGEDLLEDVTYELEDIPDFEHRQQMAARVDDALDNFQSEETDHVMKTNQKR